MASLDRDLRVGWFVFFLGLAVSWVSFTLPMRGEFIESPGIFPGLMGLLLVLFAVILIVKSLVNGGRVRVVQWGREVGPFLATPEHRPVILGIVLPAVYIFAGISLIGFYPATVLFLAIMFYLFVQRWRRWLLFLPIAIALTALLYLIFNVFFQLQIR
ncbi:MAG: tripartite tricarboxylate transporter TctB family protein [Syntrophales bacterium]